MSIDDPLPALPVAGPLARERLSAIVDTSEDAIAGKTLAGIVISWNRAAERMFGYTAAEMIGRPMMTIVPGNRCAEEEDVLARIGRGESIRHYETLRQHKDGRLIPVSISVSPILDESGVVVGAANITRDVSEQVGTARALGRAEEQQRDLQQRLSLVITAAGTLLALPTIDAVLDRTIQLARALIHADAGAVWRFDAVSRVWRMAAGSGVSTAFGARVIPLDDPTSTGVVFSHPLAIEDVGRAPLLAPFLELYQQEGIRSMLVSPLTIAGEASGTLVWYYGEPHVFSEVEVHTAGALASLVGAAITTRELSDRQREAMERSRLLAEAGATLASSLDYAATLRAVAHLAVPSLADWCTVSIVKETGEVERVATVHADPEKIPVAETLMARYLDDPAGPRGVRRVIETGTTEFAPALTDAVLAASSTSDEHLSLLRRIAPVSYLAVPLRVRGRTLGAIALVTAESGRRYTDADRRFAEDLAFRAALAIDNARSYQQAYEANQAKDEFLAVLSHELRTPLNAVLGWSRMLRTGAVSPDRVAKAVEVIERNALAQLRLVEDLLDVSRIVSGKFRLDVQPVDLSQVVQAAVDAVEPAAQAKNIRLRAVLDPRAGPVYGDAARLQQAVWNLASNAAKFTPRGGTIELALLRVNSHVELTVTDTGIGIRREALPFIFDRFRQVETGAARPHAGLGLGLAIVRQVVELHGGTVRAESEGEGHGTTFRITLPVMLAGQTTAPAAPKRRHPAVVEGAPLADLELPSIAGVRLLVVDDAEDARELLGELLRGYGASVVAVSDASQAIAAIDAGAPDVIISDIEMPGRDGFELIRAIRARPVPEGGAVPAIALTAYARPEDRSRSLLSGYQVHLAKPVDLSELIATIASLSTRLGR